MGRRKTEREKNVRRKAHRLEGKVHQSGGRILRSRRGAVVRTVEDGPVVVAGANSGAKPHVQFDAGPADPPGGTVNGEGDPRRGTAGIESDPAQAVAAGREIDLNAR